MLDRMREARRVLRHGKYNLRRHEMWSSRTDLAVRMALGHMAPVGARVADIGAGHEPVRRALLDRGFDMDYEAFDIDPQSSDVRRLNLATETPDGPFDVVFCLGLFEYLPDVADAFGRLATVTTALCHSYVTFDETNMSLTDRRRNGWTSHLSRREVESIARAAGMRCVERREQGPTDIWWWRQA